MNYYVIIYANLVKNGVKKIEDIPAECREDVKKLLAK